MHEYEIRIFKLERGTALIFASSQRTDSDAIRLAKKLAEGMPLEVWRGMDCICRDDAAHRAA